MYQSVNCSCILRPHWPGEEAVVSQLELEFYIITKLKRAF